MRARVLGIAAAVVTLLPPLHAAPLDVGGAWKLNRDFTAVRDPETERGQPGRRPEGGGGRGGRMGGRGGGRGGRGGGAGGPGGPPALKRVYDSDGR